jgi:putative ABC transport system permease protein
MLLLKLAFLNISRNPRRSAITILAVAVGLAALIFLWGFNDGTNEQMRENVIRLFTGHVQIHSAGFEKTLASELTLQDREKLLEQVKAQPETVAVAERVKVEALVGTSEKSRGVLLIGVDPQREKDVTELERYVTQGAFLGTEDNRSILIGYRLAEKIEVQIGDKVVVLTQAVDGTMSGFAYHVKGIFHTGSQTLDEMSAYITLASGQELVGIEDQSHEMVIRLKNRHVIPRFLNGIDPLLKNESNEVLRWDEIVPEVEQWAQWSEAIIRTILIAVMIIIGVSIMNTVLMSVFERTRELGIMMAVGTSPSQIVTLILLETCILELFGIILGLIAGFLVTFYFGHVGIAFPELEEAFSRSYMSTTTYTRLEINHVIQSIVTLFLLTTAIGIYPAWKAGRLEPVKAIYHS